ncbi:hypothetical protein FQN52_009064 [Onygenales sp. PD_12]|nr:hypothetical protein FQN52_009064 [Onygenales sp. PD_12]
MDRNNGFENGMKGLGNGVVNGNGFDGFNGFNGTRRGKGGGNRFVDSIFLKFNLQNRSSIVITASFSVAASVLVVLSIIYDSWQSSRRVYRPETRKRFDFLRHIPPAHKFPLMLAFASFSQSLILLAVQSTGLEDLFAEGCLAASQITWTAAWIVGYALLIFSSEAVYRSFRPPRFAAKGRWNTVICWVVFAIMLALTWIPSKVKQVKQTKRNRCLASLLQWTRRWADIGAILTVSVIVLYIANGTILTIRLRRMVKLDAHDRIAASSIVYYLAGSVLVYALVLPFWIQGTFLRPTNTSMLMGSVSLNLFGIVHAFIYLLLRANGGNMMIGPGSSAWKQKLERFDSTELALAQQISKPIVTEPRIGIVDSHNMCLEKDGIFDTDDEDEEEMRSNEKRLKLAVFNPLSTPHTPTTHSRKPSNYSIFPARNSSRRTKRFMLNFTQSRDNLLLPPRPSYARHQRFSSDISTATVQIGLRLSNIAVPSSMQNYNSSVTNVPIQSPTQSAPPFRSSFKTSTNPTTEASLDSRTEPQSEFTATTISRAGISFGPLKSNPPEAEVSPSRLSRWNPRIRYQAHPTCKNKVLPPTPLTIPKNNATFARQPSPLAQSALASPPRPVTAWPLPDVLPSSTFKQPDAWI